MRSIRSDLRKPVDRAESVVVLKRGKGKGFSGLENPLFFKSVTGMLYAQAVQKV